MGHWYAADGTPTYEVAGKSGELHDTTLRDARPLNLSPSVTSVMAILASPGLDIYKENQLAQACWDLPKKGEFKDWKTAAVRRSKEHAKKAAERGTQIHDLLEQYFLSRGISDDQEEFIRPVIELLDSEFTNEEWTPEQSFTHRLGFGGKTDLSSPNIILDFKTKATSDIKKMMAYDNHHMQTAAYAVGLDIPNAKRYNLFISTETPGLLKLTESTDFEREWGMFECCLKLWQLQNKYVPKT